MSLSLLRKRKAQMFIVTLVFITGMIFSVQQMLFQYSSLDIADSIKKEDIYLMETVADMFNRTLLHTQNCSLALERLREVDSFLRKRVRGKYILELKYNGKPRPNLNCTRFLLGESILNLSIGLVSGRAESHKVYTLRSPLALSMVEWGTITVDHNWKRIDLQKNFFRPVIVAKPLSYDEEHPAVVRIRNVNRDYFEVRIQEWDYLDGNHNPEKLGYLVVEEGRHRMDQTELEAGTVDTNATNFFLSVPFSSPFNTTPVVLTAVTTQNEDQAVTTRNLGVNSTGFWLLLQEQESNSLSHATETVSYIAWKPGRGHLLGEKFDVGTTGRSVGHNFHTVDFLQSFNSTPTLLADIQSFYGGDTASLRYRNLNTDSFQVKVQEEMSKDPEIHHPLENVGYILLGE